MRYAVRVPALSKLPFWSKWANEYGQQENWIFEWAVSHLSPSFNDGSDFSDFFQFLFEASICDEESDTDALAQEAERIIPLIYSEMLEIKRAVWGALIPYSTLDSKEVTVIRFEEIDTITVEVI